MSISFLAPGSLRGHQRRQSVSRRLQFGEASLVDKAALLHDRDLIESRGEASAVQTAKQLRPTNSSFSLRSMAASISLSSAVVASLKAIRSGRFRTAIAIAIFCRCASDSREPPVPT